nr:elongation of very long chain fatty acids protein 6-like [Bombus vancouverensis nearcticus]
MYEEDFVDPIAPEYSYVFDFEKNYSYLHTQDWLLDNIVYCICYVIFYVIVVIAGLSYMLENPKFNLKRPRALWYGLMALLSIIGFSRTAPELFFALLHHSFYHSICLPSNYFQNPVSGFWSLALVILKFIQMFDTMFIVLQKQEMTFLHVYRHLSIIIYFYFTYTETTAAMRWVSVMEYFINFCIYSYYALESMEYKVPLYLIITCRAMQILQMVTGYILTIIAYNQRDVHKRNCYITYQSAAIGAIYYIASSYFYVRYFYSTYMSRKQRNKGRKIK